MEVNFNVIGVNLKTGETFPIIFGVNVPCEEGRKLIDSYKKLEDCFAYYLEPLNRCTSVPSKVCAISFLERCNKAKYVK